MYFVWLILRLFFGTHSNNSSRLTPLAIRGDGRTHGHREWNWNWLQGWWDQLLYRARHGGQRPRPADRLRRCLRDPLPQDSR